MLAIVKPLNKRADKDKKTRNTKDKRQEKSNYNYTEEQKSQSRRDTIRLKLTQVVHEQESNEIKLYRRTQKPDQKR